jgi:hypothetical protein
MGETRDGVGGDGRYAHDESARTGRLGRIVASYVGKKTGTLPEAPSCSVSPSTRYGGRTAKQMNERNEVPPPLLFHRNITHGGVWVTALRSCLPYHACMRG